MAPRRPQHRHSEIATAGGGTVSYAYSGLYHRWYLTLLSKIVRFVTFTTQRPPARGRLGNSSRGLHTVGICMTEWARRFEEQLSPSWTKSLSPAEREAVYRELFALAERIYGVNEAKAPGSSCREAFEMALAFTPEGLRRRLALPPFLNAAHPPPTRPIPFPTAKIPKGGFSSAFIGRLLRTLTTTWLFAQQRERRDPAFAEANRRLVRWRAEFEAAFTHDRIKGMVRDDKQALLRFLDLTLFEQVKERIVEGGIEAAVEFIVSIRVEVQNSGNLGTPTSTQPLASYIRITRPANVFVTDTLPAPTPSPVLPALPNEDHMYIDPRLLIAEKPTQTACTPSTHDTAPSPNSLSS
ncbi:hypothetical protein JCM10908_002676 [Rhodotorula pacifica]|uniref:uncharacterized protein n=1 Tax=Rhodotorula pacifica TaxID=1495444 RepID=UPI003172E198